MILSQPQTSCEYNYFGWNDTGSRHQQSDFFFFFSNQNQPIGLTKKPVSPQRGAFDKIRMEEFMDLNLRNCLSCKDREECPGNNFIKCPITQIIWLNSPWPINFSRMSSSAIGWIKMLPNTSKEFNIQEEDYQSFSLFRTVLLAMIICGLAGKHFRLREHCKIYPTCDINKTFALHLMAWESINLP